MTIDPRERLVLKNGTIEWRNKNGQLDSWNDLPALIWPDAARLSSPGATFWYKNGVLHRDGDLPARVEPTGYCEWWLEGNPARPGGGPNIVHQDGTQEWTDAQMRRHRDDDLPACITASGTQAWYQHGVPHRDGDKPAIISRDGLALRYFKNGKLQRTDGPALVERNGVTAWYVDDRALGAQEIAALQAKAVSRLRTSGPKP